MAWASSIKVKQHISLICDFLVFCCGSDRFWVQSVIYSYLSLQSASPYGRTMKKIKSTCIFIIRKNHQFSNSLSTQWLNSLGCLSQGWHFAWLTYLFIPWSAFPYDRTMKKISTSSFKTSETLQPSFNSIFVHWLNFLGSFYHGVIYSTFHLALYPLVCISLRQNDMRLHTSSKL